MPWLGDVPVLGIAVQVGRLPALRDRAGDHHYAVLRRADQRQAADAAHRPRAADRRRSSADAALQPSDAAARVSPSAASPPRPVRPPASNWTRSSHAIRRHASRRGLPRRLRQNPVAQQATARHALRPVTRRHHGRRQLRAERRGPRRRAGQRPQDHCRDRPTGAARRIRRRVGRNRRADAAGARPARRPGAVQCRRALGLDVGRAGHGDGPRHRCRGALGIPDRRQQLPELHIPPPPATPTSWRCRASAAPMPTTWARCCTGRATPWSAVRGGPADGTVDAPTPPRYREGAGAVRHAAEHDGSFGTGAITASVRRWAATPSSSTLRR